MEFQLHFLNISNIVIFQVGLHECYSIIRFLSCRDIAGEYGLHHKTINGYIPCLDSYVLIAVIFNIQIYIGAPETIRAV